MASNSDYYHEALLACWWFGAVASPVNSRWSTAEITYALEDSGSTVLLVDENFASVGSTLREACPGLTTVVYCGNDRVPDGMLDYEQVIAEAIPVDDLRVGGDTLALLLYTGGTTGVPKGVMISHRWLVDNARRMRSALPIEPGMEYLSYTPLAWITEQLVALAERHCSGRIVSCLEGGYNLAALARSVAAHVGVLCRS